MTPDQVLSSLLGALSTSWATATSIAWPNRSFTPPDGPWIEPIVEMGDTTGGELGPDGVSLRNGVFQINVNVLPDTGYIAASKWASRLELAFRRKEIGGVILDDPATTPVGDVDNYYRAIVRFNFHAWIGE